MPPKHEKLLENMKNSPNNWKLNDLYSLYEGFGFTIRHGSNHDIVKHPDFPQLRETIPRSRKVAKVYIKKAIKLVERYKALSER